MLGCLLPALLFAYLINCTNFVANTAVALVPCHTAYFPALLCSRAVLLSLSTSPTVRFALSDLVILFSLFFSALASRLAHLRLFVLSCLYFILYPFDFLSSFGRSCLKTKGKTSYIKKQRAAAFVLKKVNGLLMSMVRMIILRSFSTIPIW